MHVSGAEAAAIGVAGCVVGVAGLSLAWLAWVRVRRVRDAQRVLIAGGRNKGLDLGVLASTAPPVRAAPSPDSLQAARTLPAEAGEFREIAFDADGVPREALLEPAAPAWPM